MHDEFYDDARGLLLTFGFSSVGIAKIDEINQTSRDAFENWLFDGKNGTMKFFENPEFQKTYKYPKNKYKNAKSIIAAAYPYNVFVNSDKTFKFEKQFKVSRYALNEDYHNVLKEKLNRFEALIRLKYKEAELHFQVDAGALPEVYWAEKAGIGIRRKNGLLYVPQYGSFVFIALIVTNIEIENYSNVIPRDEFCTKCNKCVNACPTNALNGDLTMDATKCLSYLTIEHKGEFKANTELHDWIFGCDICQQVCPFNEKVLLTRDKSFQPSGFWEEISVEKLHNMSNSSFRKRFTKSPLARTGLKRLLRNINANSQNNNN